MCVCVCIHNIIWYKQTTKNLRKIYNQSGAHELESPYRSQPANRARDSSIEIHWTRIFLLTSPSEFDLSHPNVVNFMFKFFFFLILASLWFFEVVKVVQTCVNSVFFCWHYRAPGNRMVFHYCIPKIRFMLHNFRMYISTSFTPIRIHTPSSHPPHMHCEEAVPT